MIWWMRHGESTWNVAGREQGTVIHPPLTDDGRRQVSDAIEAVRELHLTRIVCSPAVRAEQSARILSDALDLPLEVDERLLELGVGEEPSEVLDRVVEFAVQIGPLERVLAVSHGDTIALAVQVLTGRRLISAVANAEIVATG